MKKQIGGFLIITIFLIGTGRIPSSLAQSSNATIQQLSGTVFTTSMLPAKIGDVLTIGDAIQTQPGAWAQLVLSDGNTIKIEEDARVGLIELSPLHSHRTPCTILYLLQGRIQAKLFPNNQASHAIFQVETQNALVRLNLSQADEELPFMMLNARPPQKFLIPLI